MYLKSRKGHTPFAPPPLVLWTAVGVVSIGTTLMERTDQRASGDSYEVAGQVVKQLD